MIPQNEAALKHHHPDLLAALQPVSASSGAELVRSRKGDESLAWTGPDGEKKYLNSSFDPRSEARRFAESAAGGRPARALIVGHGIGYEIRELAARVDELWVIAANLPLLKFLAERIDLSDIFSNPRIRWLFGRPAELQSRLQALMNGRDGETEPRVIIHPPFLQTIPDEYSKLAEAVQRLQSGRETEDELRPAAEKNFRANLAALAAPGVRSLFGMARDRTVIVAGAGPSLDDSIDLLRRMHPASFLIAVDTVFEGLSAEGIVPDLVVSIDPRPDSKIHFQNPAARAILVFTPITHPDIVRRFPGRRAVAVPQNHFFLKPAEEELSPKGLLLSGGSVSILAAALAAAMEPSFVLIAGIDFRAQPGRFYSALASYHLRARGDVGRFFSPEHAEHEILSREIRTTGAGTSAPRLDHYSSDFRYLIKHSMVPFYSSGEPPVEGVRGGVLPCVPANLVTRPISLPPETDAPNSAALFQKLGIDP